MEPSASHQQCEPSVLLPVLATLVATLFIQLTFKTPFKDTFFVQSIRLLILLPLYCVVNIPARLLYRGVVQFAVQPARFVYWGLLWPVSYCLEYRKKRLEQVSYLRQLESSFKGLTPLQIDSLKDVYEHLTPDKLCLDSPADRAKLVNFFASQPVLSQSQASRCPF
jgi:hypothetical protein